MKKTAYKSSSESRHEAAKIPAHAEGRATLAKGTETHLVLAPKEIKRIRQDVLKMTQAKFAQLLRKQPITIQSWEQGIRVPDSTTTFVIYLLGTRKIMRKLMAKTDVQALTKAVA